MAANVGLTNAWVRSLAMHPDVPHTVYAGTEGDGVFCMTVVPSPFTLRVSGPNADCGADPPLDCTTLSAGFAAGATDGLDPELGEVEMPPLPPTVDIFDVRFLVSGTEGLLRDLRPPDAVDPEWHVAVQAGLGGYPLTFRWDPSALPEGHWTLRDTLDGALGVDVDMRVDSTLALANAQVTSVVIATDADTVTVSVTYPSGWSMVGAPHNGAPVSAIEQTPASSIVSIFCFAGSYQQVDLAMGSLSAGHGYWVNLAQSARLVMRRVRESARR